MIKTSAPGKLVIAGEWAVLHPGNLAIVTAIDRRANVTLKANNNLEITIKAPDYHVEVAAQIQDNQIIFDTVPEEEKLEFLISAILTVHSYQPFSTGFTLTTDSSQCMMEVEKKSIKVGFGSSAAITVAAVAAMLEHNNCKYSKDELFKLSCLSHFNAQEKVGSCLDIAAAVYGGTFSYSRFDPDWLVEELTKTSLSDLVKADWKDFSHQKLDELKNLKMLVAFTGNSADTRELIKSMQDYESENPKIIKKIYDKIHKNTQKLISNWKDNREKKIVELLNFNQTLLVELSRRTEIKIATPRLQKIGDIALIHNAAGKLSGAGGGDCGIIFAEEENVSKIRSELKNQPLHEINAAPDANGYLVS